MRLQLVTTLFALAIVGCGSSVEPERPAPPPVTNPTPDPTPAPAARTLKTAPLLPYAAQNMLLDVSFREGGWGKFTTFYNGAFSQLQTPSRIFSDSPGGVGAPVGIFKDQTATDDKSREIVSLCSFLGGQGPFVARVWVSRTNVAGDPVEFPDAPETFRASIGTRVSGVDPSAIALARKSSQVHGKRTWFLYEARIDGDLPTAFFLLRFGRTGGGFMVTAPEVVPLKLLEPGDTKKSFEAPAKRFVLDEVERFGITAYSRMPHQLGAPKLPKLVPGKPTSLAD